MGNVESFFSCLGWGMFVSGFASCLIPNSFKKGVVLMLLGDLFLMLAILYPRVFADWSFFSLSSGYKAFGVLLSIFIWMAFFLPSFYCRKNSVVHALTKEKNSYENKGSQKYTFGSEKSTKKASPEIFAKVHKARIVKKNGTDPYSANMTKKER